MNRHVQATLPDDDYRAFRTEVVRRGQTVQSALAEAISIWLREHPFETPALPLPSWRGMLHSDRSLSEELIAERRLEAEDPK